MTLNHTTLPECPVCHEDGRGVVDPDSETWHCFFCGSSGDSKLVLTTTHVGPRAPAGSVTPVAAQE